MENQNHKNNNAVNQIHVTSKIGQYILDPANIIGRGYSSKVYMAQNASTRAKVAIKVVEKIRMSSPDQVRSNRQRQIQLNKQVHQILLQNQLYILERNKHPHVLRAHQIIHTNNNTYIVTDLFQQNLQDYLHKNGKFNESQVISFLVQMTAALSYLQENGVVHRDFKISNIFIKGNRYVLGDFGFCDYPNSPEIQKSFNIGSPYYMSPQSYRFSIYSHQGDIWSLGVCYRQSFFIQNYHDPKYPFQPLWNKLAVQKFYRNLSISKQLKYILDLIFNLDVNSRINSKDLIQILINFGYVRDQNIILLNQCPQFYKIDHYQKIKSSHKRNPSIRTIQNSLRINFKKGTKKKLNQNLQLNNENGRKILIESQNQDSTRPVSPVPLNEIPYLSNNKIPKINRKISIKERQSSHHQKLQKYYSPSHFATDRQKPITYKIPQFLVFKADEINQNLTQLQKTLLQDPHIHLNLFKIKLCILVSIAIKVPFPYQLSTNFMQQTPDYYFSYVMQTFSQGKIKLCQILHYLIFLIETVLRSQISILNDYKYQNNQDNARIKALKLVLFQSKKKLQIENKKQSEKQNKNHEHLSNRQNLLKSKSDQNLIKNYHLPHKLINRN